MKLSWRGRILVHVAGLLPRWLLEEPERALLYFACFLIGVSAFLPPPGSLLDLWPDWRQFAFACFMAAGGALSLISQITGDRAAERVGALGVLIPSGWYGIDLVVTYGVPRVVSSVIFIALALAGLLRLLRSSAAAAAILSHLRYLAAAQDRAEDDPHSDEP